MARGLKIGEVVIIKDDPTHHKWAVIGLYSDNRSVMITTFYGTDLIRRDEFSYNLKRE